MTDEIKTEQTVSDVQKSEDSTSLVSLVAELVRKQDARIDSFEKRFDGLESLLKEKNDNPVDQGVEAENKPKVEGEDVGDKVTVGNEVAPKPSESQASIIAPAVEQSGSDKSGLQMENKSDDEDKKEEKKDEEVEKTEDKEEDKKEVEKSVSSEYEIVETVRPISKHVAEGTEYPTGYQVLKAIVGGWNGQTTSADQAMTIAYNKLQKGEFGTGTDEGVLF